MMEVVDNEGRRKQIGKGGKEMKKEKDESK
jgi:hypothetical protein